MKSFLYLFLALFLLVFLVYLFLPSPEVQPLPNSLKSQEPGDTWQVTGAAGYYTDMKRADVLDFYQKTFSLVFLNFSFSGYRLNNPPEYAKQVIRNEITVSYFEEIVHPFRETLMVTGFEPSVYYKGNPSKIAQTTIFVGDKNYFSKVTIRYLPTPIWKRLLLFVFSLFSIGGLILIWKKILKSGWSLDEKV